MKYRLIFIIIVVFLSSCNSFQKLLKSDNVPLKYEKAKEYFNRKEYNKCILLLETILPYYRSTKEGEKINFFYAFSEYAMGNYLSASYRFKDLYETYPFGHYADSSLFLYAVSLYELSPPVDLDQSSSSSAIEALQLFVTRFPNNSKVEDANKYMDELMAKLELRDYNTAKLYYKIQDYRAAAWSLKKFLEKYPSTDKKTEINYYILNSYYRLALNSVEDKKQERFGEVISWYRECRDNFKNTRYEQQAQNIYINTQNQLKKLK